MSFSELDYRALMTPPPECLLCAHRITTETGATTRHRCRKDKPMHPACPWFEARALGIDEGKTT